MGILVRMEEDADLCLGWSLGLTRVVPFTRVLRSRSIFVLAVPFLSIRIPTCAASLSVPSPFSGYFPPLVPSFLSSVQVLMCRFSRCGFTGSGSVSPF